MRMADRAEQKPPRRATNVSLRADLIEEARSLDINISQACETGLVGEVKKAREARWLAENLPALEAWNQWVSENGIPYAEYRQF
jgi:antitoxin CcdA